MRLSFFKSLFVCAIAFLVLFGTDSNFATATTSYYYDLNGKLVQQSDVTGETVRYTYDYNGNLVSRNSGEPYFELMTAFGSKQGENNWYYQLWDGTRYKDMTWD
ncbi:hypothetical protein GC101_09650, partial [Paenibacillus sp. LMG 31459]